MAEHIIDGGFDNPGDWGASNATVSGGKGNLDSGAVTKLLFQTTSLVQGNTYLLSIDCDTLTTNSGNPQNAIINEEGDFIYIVPAAASGLSHTFTHNSASGQVYIRALAGGTMVVDNFSIIDAPLDPTEELLYNGDFETGTKAGWFDENSYYTIVGNQLYHPLGGFNPIYANPNVTNGVDVTIKIDCTIVTGIARIQYTQDSDGATITVQMPTTDSYEIPVIGGIRSNTSITISRIGADAEFYIDNVSIKQPAEPTTTVEIEWIDSISAAATGNKIYRDDVEIADIANGVQIYQDATAETGTEYKYEVQAYSATDETTQEVLGVNVQYITTA